MTTQLRFDGRVAIVTGAGGGMGRAHALLLASRGAKVVVNDLGGSVKGDGQSSAAADSVVNEIKAAGGEAVANHDSVEHGDKIVKTAIDAFGRIDIVINNAGILRDVSYPKMADGDWDLVYRVHVLGAHRVTHAAWSHMRDAGYGRIIMTTSTSGIYGNFGQANYAMAKAGLIGLTRTLALEGKKRNIVVNAIAPTAGSRMTEGILPPALLDALRPELVSPLVARLCHESNEDTGGLYEVGGGFFAKLRWERTAGKMFRIGRPATLEDVDAAWPQITGFEGATHPANNTEALQPLLENIEAGPSKGGNQFIDVDAALGYSYPELTFRYDERDVALYALGVGAAKDPTDARDLPLVYELAGTGMKVLPSFGALPAINMVFAHAKAGTSAPGLHYGLDRVLHGEQHVELKRPLPTRATLSTKATIKSIYDKGKGAVINTEFVTYDEHGDELLRNQMATFVRGAGGWGGERGPSADVNVPPDRAPDKLVEDRTSENQALLYRLSGDWNPLHADPAFAKAMGFARPILHGLCSFGFAARHVAQAFAPDGNVDFVRSIRVRFASTVLPGQTIVTEMWKDSPTRIIFRCKVKETGETCISSAAVELWTELPRPKARAAAAEAAPASPGGAPAPTSGDIFRAIGGFLRSDPATAEKVKTTYLFKLSAPESSWTIDLSTPPGSVSEGTAGTPACTLDITDADFMAMATGKVDAMKLFSTGKLKISGDVMASQKLSFMRKLTPEMVIAEMKRRTGAAAAPAGAAPAPAAAPAIAADPQAPKVFAALTRRLADHPGLKDDVRATLSFRVTGPDQSQTVALGGADASTPDAVVTISDADLAALASGSATPRQLYQQGKLRIDGDVSVGHRLGFLKGLI